jgi:hypothetical protein
MPRPPKLGRQKNMEGGGAPKSSKGLKDASKTNHVILTLMVKNYK